MEGTRLGPYHVLAELGSGGMGKVYRAELTREAAGLDAGTAVAIKVIHAHLLEQEGFFQRFLREADIGRSVQHENVVRTFVADALMVDGAPQHFLVMEFVEGQTLRDLLAELERVPEELCRHIGCEVAKGLAAIHEAGVVHRDLKPENVLITPEHVVKVMDLGVARLQDEAIRLSQAGAFVGSLEYAAPEQFRAADSEPDGRADLHSLGVLLYELATGQHPYRDEDASKVLRNILEEAPRKAGELNPQLSPFFEEVVQALIAKDREERFPAAADLAVVLEEGEKSDWWRERARALRIQTKRPLRRIRVPRETALYGRDDDLAKLHTLYEKARAGDGQVLLIEGEAGIGKTRLVDEFVGRLRQEGEDVNFLFGSYPPGGAATASGAFSEAYREQFGSENLEKTLAEYVKPTPILIPAFAAVLKGETTPRDTEPLTKDALHTVFVHATRGLAAERTTIVLIDDLHFAPENGRALFTSLALAIPEHRVLLLGTTRSSASEPWITEIDRLVHAERTVLHRLGPKHLATLLKDAFRSERLARELALKISEKSDGNPFFVFEIVRSLREGRLITERPDGTWITTRMIQDVEVPSTVVELLKARLTDLAETDQEILDVAACCGFEFDPLLVARVLEADEITVLRSFGRLESRHKLVRSAGRAYRFDHHQLQETVHASLSELLRERYHLAIGKALEQRTERMNGATALTLWHHFDAAGQQRLSAPSLLHAIEFLGDQYRSREALDLSTPALDWPEFSEGAARADLLYWHGRCLSLVGNDEEERRYVPEAWRIAISEGTDELRARVGRQRGYQLLRLGEPERAREVLSEALASAESAQDPFQQGNARALLGMAATQLGELVAARGHYERALSYFRAIGHRLQEGMYTGNLGQIYRLAGRWGEAQRCLEADIEISAEAGNSWSIATALHELGTLYTARGDLSGALKHFQESVEVARAASNVRAEVFGLRSLGNVEWMLGDADAIQSRFEESEGVRIKAGQNPDAVRDGLLHAHLAELRGDRPGARELVEGSLAQAREKKQMLLVGDCLVALSRLSGAEDHTGELHDLGIRLDIPRWQLLGEAYRIAACGGSPDVDLPRDVQDRSPLLDRMEGAFVLWKAHRRPDHLSMAHEFLQQLVDSAPETCRISMVERVPLHSQVMKAWEAQQATDA